MKPNKKTAALPRYRGTKWIEPVLPDQAQYWELGKHKSIRKERGSHGTLPRELRQAIGRKPWRWPKRTLYFFSDLHADTDGFIASLVASGGIKKTGDRDRDFKLTREGRKARFLIGGDCFDKGPSNLRLLRMIRQLMDRDADVQLLAGNHDVRVLLGIRAVDLPPDPRTDHFFIRMGPKMIPFLKEISDEYLQGRKALRDVPNTRECRRRLFPSQTWFREFPHHAGWVMQDRGIERELQRLEKKMSGFEEKCKDSGLSLRMLYAATRKWQELFIHPRGEFHWFFRGMNLARREGSFLFIHAGLDDRIARVIDEAGISGLNRQFRKQLRGDLFDFYYGPLANTMRTKYRDVDMPLTRNGVRYIHQKGIRAIVHGHVHLQYGQRIMLRKGMLNFECDASLDRGTRSREGLKGHGAAVTIFHRDRVVMGISADYPYIKLFEPDTFSRQFDETSKSAPRNSKKSKRANPQISQRRSMVGKVSTI